MDNKILFADAKKEKKQASQNFLNLSKDHPFLHIVSQIQDDLPEIIHFINFSGVWTSVLLKRWRQKEQKSWQ